MVNFDRLNLTLPNCLADTLLAMMTPFTPFAELTPAFSIGLKPVDPVHFLQIDEQAPRYIAEKKALYDSQYDDVFMQEPDTYDGQQEAAALILKAADVQVEMPETLPPLGAAALEVADDLLLLRRDPSGWRLVAASVCFPSSWNLASKFGRPLEEIHAPVPGMEGKMGERIRRIFDMLKPNLPVWRQSWAIDPDGELRHDSTEMRQTGDHKSKALNPQGWLRTEYQTLHKLPKTGDILFTVKILAKPFAEIAAQKNGPDILLKLHDEYFSMGEKGRTYKGINKGAESFLEWLKQVQSNPNHGAAK